MKLRELMAFTPDNQMYTLYFCEEIKLKADQFTLKTVLKDEILDAIVLSFFGEGSTIVVYLKEVRT